MSFYHAEDFRKKIQKVLDSRNRCRYYDRSKATCRAEQETTK